MNKIKINQLSICFAVILMLVLTGCKSPLMSTPVSEITPTAKAQGAGLQFYLTADKAPVSVSHDNKTATPLAKGQTMAVSANDKIIVGDGGIGKLLYSDRVVVEILQGSEVVLGELTSVAGDRIEASVIQDFGHTHITIGDNAKAGIILKTNDSTITSLTDGTEFSVCYAPGKDGLTCHPVLKGSIQVFGKSGKSMVYTAPPPVGAYTFNGQDPEPPKCFHDQEYRDWLTQMRNGEKVEALGALVDKWYNEPCPEGAASPSETQAPTPMAMESPTPMAMDTPAPTSTSMAMETTPQTSAYFSEEFNSDIDLSMWPSFQWNSLDEGKYSPKDVPTVIQDGFLKFEIKKPNLSTFVTYNPSSYGDVKISLSAHNSGQNSSSISLLCHISSEGWYEFNIKNNGLYSILGYMAVEKKYYTLFNGGSNAIHVGMGVNEYSATCKGNELSLSINGKAVNTVKDSMHQFGEGKVGLGSSSNDEFTSLNEVDWFKIEKP
jgi:hypothetical protein